MWKAHAPAHSIRPRCRPAEPGDRADTCSSVRITFDSRESSEEDVRKVLCEHAEGCGTIIESGGWAAMTISDTSC